MRNLNEKSLMLGDTGEQVKILQEKLKILGFYPAMITGSFGEATEQGVIAFQRANQFDATGVVDEETWNALLFMTEPPYATISLNPTLQLGSVGTSVEELQKKLKALLYYQGPITSVFDLETENAVKRFQYLNDLTTTGIVNSTTWNVLNRLYGNILDCAKETEDENSSVTYQVQSGDTLYSIARKYDTTVDAIKTLNNLTSNNLSIGQILRIPTSSVEENFITYQVQSGDTLYNIARKYDTTVDAIKTLNGLTSNILRIGQILRIPTSNVEENVITYQVQSGDTLYSIARKYDTTVDAIKSLNELTNNTLMIGQILRIPTSSVEENFITYQVQSGDTLYNIARKYDTTVDAIKTLNGLTSNILMIGQILRIPVS